MNINRRKFERFTVRPMYTPVSVRTLDREDFAFDGHCYDLSEGGLQFELDTPIAPGTPVAIQLTLPNPDRSDIGPGRAIFILGNVVWLDDSEPGPVRLAVAITRFARWGDRERLMRQLGSGVYQRAA